MLLFNNSMKLIPVVPSTVVTQGNKSVKLNLAQAQLCLLVICPQEFPNNAATM